MNTGVSLESSYTDTTSSTLCPLVHSQAMPSDMRAVSPPWASQGSLPWPWKRPLHPSSPPVFPPQACTCLHAFFLCLGFIESHRDVGADSKQAHDQHHPQQDCFREQRRICPHALPANSIKERLQEGAIREESDHHHHPLTSNQPPHPNCNYVRTSRLWQPGCQQTRRGQLQGGGLYGMWILSTNQAEALYICPWKQRTNTPPILELKP